MGVTKLLNSFIYNLAHMCIINLREELYINSYICCVKTPLSLKP